MNDIVVSSDKQFSRALFGLNKNEVYLYLSQMSSAYEELKLQIQVLQGQNDKLTDSNRDNALKIRNMQADIQEAQKKTDRANVELEAAKKEAAALRKELALAEARIQKLTDDLIKAGAGDTATAQTVEEPVVVEEPASVVVEEPESKAFTPKPIFEEEEKKKEEPVDIFAQMRAEVAQENAAKAEPVVESTVDTTSSADSFDDDEVYSGEVEIKVDESMLIGNDDDEEEGFSFL